MNVRIGLLQPPDFTSFASRCDEHTLLAPDRTPVSDEESLIGHTNFVAERGQSPTGTLGPMFGAARGAGGVGMNDGQHPHDGSAP